MKDIVNLIFEAQADTQKLNTFVADFLPFIKSCVTHARVTRQSQEDSLTLAMLAFTNCVMAYKPENGSFLSFAQVSIRNRLIDDFRIEHRHASKTVPLLVGDSTQVDWEISVSVDEYQRQLERETLKTEIEELTHLLNRWNTSFAELTKICPKQKRTRAQCEYIATLILNNDAWRTQLFEKHRMPNKQMCAEYGVSVKTLEKYRKYIATLCVIQYGDFPMLRAFLPLNKKGGIFNG